MFFNDLIQRRLVSLLQPWLSDEPDLELKLGFLRSRGTVNNLNFNTSALNQSLDDSTRFRFKQVTAQQLSLRLSHWSSPAFTLRLHGLRVTLSLGEGEEQGIRVRPRRKPRDTSLEDKKKVLAEIDPQGSALHDAIKRISDVTAGSWRTNLVTTILKYGQLQVDDIHVLVLSPSSDDSVSCSLDLKELGAKSHYIGHGCFIGGFIGSFFRPIQKCSFDIDISFEIDLKSPNCSSKVVSPTDISASITLENLECINFFVCFPALRLSFSPADLAIISTFYLLSCSKSKYSRTGRQLWRIAASKIGSLVSTPKFSLRKVVSSLYLWLHYVHSYEEILLLMGYPIGYIFKKSATKMFSDKRYSETVKHLWCVISEFEKELPAEAIAQARRIGRCKASGSVQLEENDSDEPCLSRLLRKVYQLLAFIRTMTCHVLLSIARLLFLKKILGLCTDHPKIDRYHKVVCEDFFPNFCICLNVGNFSILVSLENGVHPPPRQEPSSTIRFSYEDLVSFHLSSEAFFLRYSNNLTENSLMFSCGCIRLFPSSFTEGNSHEDHNFSRKRQKKKVPDSQAIFWCEPAVVTAAKNHATDTEGASIPVLESFLQRLWLNWKNIYNSCQGNNLKISETPWVLVESRHLLLDQNSRDLASGLYNLGMLVGRLNFVLEYWSVMSLAVVFGQVQHALFWTDCSKGADVLHTPPTVDGVPVISMNSKFEYFFSRIETIMRRVIPQKHMEVGVIVTGPKVKISLSKDKFLSKNTDLSPISKKDELWLSFDVDDIELVVSPYSESGFTSTAYTADCNEQYNSLPLYELQSTGILKSTNDINSCQESISLTVFLKFNGLKAYISKLSGNSCYQFIMLSPASLQSTTLRKDFHSLGSTVLASSAALRWMATGFTAFLFLDELLILVEVLTTLYSSVSHALTYFGSNGGQSCQDLLEKVTGDAYSDFEEAPRDRENEASLVSTDTHFGFKSTCELKMMNIVLYNSRISINPENHMLQTENITSRNLCIDNMLDCGLQISFYRISVRFSFECGIAKLLIDLSGIQSVIVKYSAEIVERIGQLDPTNLLNSLNCVCEASVSCCKLSVCLSTTAKVLPSECWRNEVDASTSGGNSCLLEDSLIVTKTERSPDHSCYWLCMNIFLSEIYMAECSVKNVLVQKHKPDKFEASLWVGGQCQEICCQSQGGFIYLETTAVVMLAKCLIQYCGQISDMWPAAPVPEKCIVAQYSETMVDLDCHRAQNFQQFQKAQWNQPESFSISLSKLSLSLVATDEIGRLQEFLFEADFHLNLKVQNTLRKVSLEIPKFSILSQFLDVTMEQQSKETQISHFSSVHGDPSVTDEHRNLIDPLHGDSSGTTASIPQSEFCTNNSKESCGDSMGSKILNSTVQNYILKELHAFIVVESPVTRDGNDPVYLNQVWAGNGSVSGLDMTLSLTEIQVMYFALESLCGILVEERTNDRSQRHWSIAQESEGSLGDKLPDGTIVAIEDVYQHMYIAVENAESSYNLVGTIHYSLVGDRALFRVKHHNPGRWKRQDKYFSLISLYAKGESGEPLRLNCRPRSDFVDISGSHDSARTLWSVLPYRTEAYDGDSEWESYPFASKHTFYLVNKGNDRAVAFIDGVLEFVTKPGNPIKLKMFHDPLPENNNLFPVSSLVGAPKSGFPHDSQGNDLRVLNDTAKLQGVTIIISKITLTIVHELPDMMEKFPLLQGSMNTTEIIAQILNTKLRFMSRLEFILRYFDAQRNVWRELVHPLDVYIFYRYRFLQGPENVLTGVPGHFHARIKEFSISLSELSLDILLFVIGKLKLAGPFAVRSSAILANCCKVENRSGLTLLCQFFDNQHATVAGRQSTTILLRHVALANQPPEASVFSIRLADQGALATSLIHLSLLEARVFAWRTRVVSSKESKTFPGPFVVVEVSRRTEEGLSIIVSPLLRIYNETDFSMELRFQRPQQKETEFASLVLKAGDSVDDSLATFGATNMSGGSKKALISLSVGNFLLSFRPRIPDELLNDKISSMEWSDELKGGKPVRLSGIFDKLSYQVRAAFSIESVKCDFSTVHCALRLEGGALANIYFLIQSIGKEVPVIQPDNFGYAPIEENLPITLQEQKEIFLLPTFHVSNLLHTEIRINLTDADPQAIVDYDNICSQATISCGAAVNLYANPASIFFIVTLTEFDSSCKPVNSSEWVKKLQKQKNTTRHLDIELNFDGGKFFAILRLSRGHRGMLEAVVFTSYALRNDTDFSLCCFAGNHKSLSRDEVEKHSSRIPPELGTYLPPKSTRSLFMKYHKVRVKLMEEKASEALLDLDALSGLAEIGLELEENSGVKSVVKLGVSIKPSFSKSIPSQIVYVKPRHVVLNQSEEVINVRQCYLEDDLEGIITVNSKQRAALQLQNVTRKKGEMTIIEKLLRKHSNSLDDPLLFIQFRPNDVNFGWSGPVCVSSLGQFFLKFRRSDYPVRQLDPIASHNHNSCEFAAAHIVEEDSTLVLHFYRPPNVDLPYRIENCFCDSAITFYQKGSMEPEVLGSGCITNYVWDDLTLPHKLVVRIDDIHVLREISLDKVRAWKPFYRTKHQTGMGFLLLDKKPGEKDRTNYGQLISTGTVKLGYEVYTDGLTRVLRFCEFADSRKWGNFFYSTSKMRFRISYFALQLLECDKQEKDMAEASVFVPIILTRLENVDIHSIFTYQHKVNQISVQSLSVDQKWIGAPFASVLRKHQSEYTDTNDKTLRLVLVLLSSSSMVKQIKHLLITLQPLDLNLDEETLMRIVPFWRKSLSDPNAPSQQYYFDHFEIHPIKIVASFLPRDSYASYSSTQETLRSLLHSVIKIPTIKNMTVELNGVLVAHALITLRELSIKCAQHYSWYAMRAIYIAKGSPLLPPAFASIFDDFASSSLDIFFDPTSGLINLPGLTMGTFKLLSKCINGKGLPGTKRYFGDLGKTLKLAGSNVLFAAVTEVSDSVLKGAESNGFNGMVRGFHQGILRLAMEPSLLGSAVLEGGRDRRIRLDRTPGVDELYIEGYLQALLDTLYKQEYLKVRVVDDQVILKNLPPSTSLINEIMERVNGFLVSKALLKGDSSSVSHSLRHIRGESEWRIGPTLLTLCEHLFVSFAIRALRKQVGKFITRINSKEKMESDKEKAVVPTSSSQDQKVKLIWRWGIGKFILSGIVAYVDGRLCRCIPNPIARRVVSGFLLSFLDNDKE